MGEDFVAANGERSFFLFMIARWACIPFSWIGAVVCYLWARDLFGRPSGVFACTLWCFSPNILAHASLITADVGGTALGVAACYTFWRWLKKPTWTQAALTGCVLGLAELCKTTLILFYPLWPLLWVAYRWGDRYNMHSRDWTREAGMLLLRMAIGIYVLNLGYGFEGSGEQLKEFRFVSTLFMGQETRDESLESSDGATSASSTNRFANTWITHLPVPFPRNYLLGIDIQQRDFENYGRPSYLRSKWQDRGWCYYYLYAGIIKVPLATWLLGLLALFLAVRKKKTAIRNPKFDIFFLLTPPLVIFCVVSSKTGFSEHFRYVLPCFPFAFIGIASLVKNSFKNCLTTDEKQTQSQASSTLVRRWLVLFAPATIAASLACWLISSSLWIYPHSLSYFNEVVGGPLNGSKHLLGSSVDWGQDLRYLRWWILDQSEQSQSRPFHLAYFGFFHPADVGFMKAKTFPNQVVADRGGSLVPQVTRYKPPFPGVYAISSNLLAGYPWLARDGKYSDYKVRTDVSPLFSNVDPDAYAGPSILVFFVQGSETALLEKPGPPQ